MLPVLRCCLVNVSLAMMQEQS